MTFSKKELIVEFYSSWRAKIDVSHVKAKKWRMHET